MTPSYCHSEFSIDVSSSSNTARVCLLCLHGWFLKLFLHRMADFPSFPSPRSERRDKPHRFPQACSPNGRCRGCNQNRAKVGCGQATQPNKTKQNKISKFPEFFEVLISLLKKKKTRGKAKLIKSFVKLYIQIYFLI